MSATEGLRPSLATVEVLAADALAQLDALILAVDLMGDPEDARFWRDLAREYDDLAMAARAVEVAIRIRDAA